MSRRAPAARESRGRWLKTRQAFRKRSGIETEAGRHNAPASDRMRHPRKARPSTSSMSGHRYKPKPDLVNGVKAVAEGLTVIAGDTAGRLLGARFSAATFPRPKLQYN